MNWLEKYKKRVRLNGETLRDNYINEQREILESSFEDHPSYQEVFLNDASDPSGLWIIENSNTKDTQEFISPHNHPINAGDLIRWNDWIWMVTTKDDKTDIYHKGIISKCISTFKWMDDLGIIRETYFTYRNEDLTNFGINDGKIIAFGNERRHIYIPFNEHTAKIKKNKRYIIDERAWKVISVDRLKKGLIYLVLLEDELDPASDNLELGIANYVDYQFSARIIGGDNISISAGQSRKLDVEITRNGEIRSGYEIEWLSSNPDVVDVDDTGNISAIANGISIITARIKDKPDIFDTVTISVQLSPVDRIAVSINGIDVLTVGDQANYKAVITNNGVVDATKNVQWSLWDEDGITPTTKAIIVKPQFSQCDIKANSVGKVKLKCVVIGYPASTFTKEIIIKHLF